MAIHPDLAAHVDLGLRARFPQGGPGHKPALDTRAGINQIGSHKNRYGQSWDTSAGTEVDRPQVRARRHNPYARHGLPGDGGEKLEIGPQLHGAPPLQALCCPLQGSGLLDAVLELICERRPPLILPAIRIVWVPKSLEKS
jgi:hypothetical protein